MDNLFAGVTPFVAVAEERSFRAAARRLGVTPAAISKAIGRLEGELGVRLLHRTTRSVSLSPEGEVFLSRCREAIAQLRAGRERVVEAQQEPSGELRLSLSHALSYMVMERLPDFLRDYPRLNITLQVTDRFVSLMDEDVDVALRIGSLPDSSLIARKLRDTRWVTAAAPTYLKEHGTPTGPEELTNHACLAFIAPTGLPVDWQFKQPSSATTTLRVDGPLTANQGDVLLEAARRGIGIVQAMDFMLAPMLADSSLVQVLAQHVADGPPVHALCRPGAARSPRVRALLQCLVAVFGY